MLPKALAVCDRHENHDCLLIFKYGSASVNREGHNCNWHTDTGLLGDHVGSLHQTNRDFAWEHHLYIYIRRLYTGGLAYAMSSSEVLLGKSSDIIPNVTAYSSQCSNGQEVERKQTQAIRWCTDGSEKRRGGWSQNIHIRSKSWAVHQAKVKKKKFILLKHIRNFWKHNSSHMRPWQPSSFDLEIYSICHKNVLKPGRRLKGNFFEGKYVLVSIKRTQRIEL